MTRPLTAVLLVFAFAPVASAQDMPLSQILIDGEEWKAAGGKAERPPGRDPLVAASPDRSTVFTWQPGERFIHAAQARAGGPPVHRSPYAPLRVAAGRSPEVTALTVDRDGRIYAATPAGVQVFDPTGRLCGVLHPPAPGPMTGLALDGDRLATWVGGTRYTRKLRTAGAE